MSTWTQQTGFPLVRVREQQAAERGRRCRTLALSQSRFLVDGTRDERSLWRVPITLRYAAADGSVKTRTTMLAERAQSVELDDAAADGWIKVSAAAAAAARGLVGVRARGASALRRARPA